jgi:hypothetical protein
MRSIGWQVGAWVIGLHGVAAAADPLPEGDAGIAARYPGDVGIARDPDVVFADDFESYADAEGLGANWDAAVYQADRVRITSERGHVHRGRQALEMEVPQQDTELSNATDKTVSPERDVLFLRYYSRFESPYDVVGSSHNGSMISAHYFENGQATPGVPADGTNKFLANLENWRGDAETPSPGHLNLYVYHPEQRSEYGDHFFPTGVVLPNSSLPFDFGPDFESRPDILPALDEWHCYEYMVQANTPGVRDGRIAVWYDGALAADFQNLRLRDVETLRIDRFGLSFHIGSNPAGDTHKWYDDVVAAGAYIGPVFEPGAGDDTAGDDAGSDGDAGGSSDGDTASATGAGGTGGGGPGGATEAAGDGAASEGPATESPSEDADGGGCACVAAGREPATVWLGVWLGVWFGLSVARRRRLGARPGYDRARGE